MIIYFVIMLSADIRYYKQHAPVFICLTVQKLQKKNICFADQFFKYKWYTKLTLFILLCH